MTKKITRVRVDSGLGEKREEARPVLQGSGRINSWRRTSTGSRLLLKGGTVLVLGGGLRDHIRTSAFLADGETEAQRWEGTCPKSRRPTIQVIPRARAAVDGLEGERGLGGPSVSSPAVGKSSLFTNPPSPRPHQTHCLVLPFPKLGTHQVLSLVQVLVHVILSAHSLPA